MHKILNFGSLNIDKTYTVPHIVKPGETLSSLNYEEFVGGKGLNSAIAVARAGSQIYMAGAVGQDGDILLNALKESNVDTSHVAQLDALSGHAIIQIDKNGENCIVLFPGTNASITQKHIDKVLSHFNEGDYLILQNEINHLDQIISKAHAKRMIICFNPSPMTQAVLEYPLSDINWFVVNEIEVEQLLGVNEQNEVIEAFTKKYPNASLLVTLGAKGSYCYHKGELYEQEAVKANVVDTTGAGDTFTGYFIHSISTGESIPSSLKIASIASSIAISKHGASPSIPTYKEVQAKL